MKAIFLLLAFLSVSSYGADKCQLQKLEDLSADDPECYFYSGTTAFRAKDFEKAASYWKSLISLKSVPVEAEHLKVDAYNNLGYLYFYGNGVKINKKAALEYWAYALKAGNEEAAYHLCHAHAERKEPTYNPSVALGYCKEALRRYALLKERDEQIEDIVSQLRSYVQGLEK